MDESVRMREGLLRLVVDVIQVSEDEALVGVEELAEEFEGRWGDLHGSEAAQSFAAMVEQLRGGRYFTRKWDVGNLVQTLLAQYDKVV